jgi:hypothetical protein
MGGDKTTAVASQRQADNPLIGLKRRKPSARMAVLLGA